MSGPPAFLAILLCLPLFAHTVYSAAVRPVQPRPLHTNDNALPNLWYLPGTPGPASQENEFHYAISIKNRTIPPTHISGQAIQGLMTQAMWDLAQKPRNKVLDDSYSYTASYPTGVPFKYTVSIGVKPTSQSERGLWEVTNANLMDGLYVVSALYSIQADVNALDEWSFDFIVLDPWRSRNATIIAKGSIAQPPKPLGKPVSGVATA